MTDCIKRFKCLLSSLMSTDTEDPKTASIIVKDKRESVEKSYNTINKSDEDLEEAYDHVVDLYEEIPETNGIGHYQLYNMVNHIKHDLVIQALKRHLAGLGLQPKLEDEPLSSLMEVIDFDVPEDHLNKTPDLIYLQRDKLIIIEVKCRAPSTIILDDYVNKYLQPFENMSNMLLEVICLNYYNGWSMSYSDNCSFPEEYLIGLPANEKVDDMIDMVRLINQRMVTNQVFNHLVYKLDVNFVEDTVDVCYKEFFEKVSSENGIRDQFDKNQWRSLIWDTENVTMLDPKKREPTKDLLNKSTDLLDDYIQFRHLNNHVKKLDNAYQSGTYDYKGTNLEMDMDEYVLSLNADHDIINNSKPVFYISYARPLGQETLKRFLVNEKFSRTKYYKHVFGEIRSDEPTLKMLSGLLKTIDWDEYREKQRAQKDEIKALPVEDREPLYKKIIYESGQVRGYQSNAFEIESEFSRSFKNFIRNVHDKKPRDPGVASNNLVKKVSLSFDSETRKLAKTKMTIVNKLLNEPCDTKNFLANLQIPDSHRSLVTKELKEEFLNNNHLRLLADQQEMMLSAISLSNVMNKKIRILTITNPNIIGILYSEGDPIKRKDNKVSLITVGIHMFGDETFLVNSECGTSKVVHDKITFSISKPITLDLLRMKHLIFAPVRYIVNSMYYLNVNPSFNDYYLCSMLATMCTKSGLSISDPFKNMVLTSLSDYSNIETLIPDKYRPRAKTWFQLDLINRQVEFLKKVGGLKKEIQSNTRPLVYNQDDVLIEGGFNANIEVTLPYSNLQTNQVAQIFQECFLYYYNGAKGLHNTEQSILDLYVLSFKFEEEYQTYLKEHKTIFKDTDSIFSVDYELLRLGSLKSYQKIQNSIGKIREGEINKEGYLRPLLTISQFTSTKACNGRVKYLEPTGEDLTYKNKLFIPEDVKGLFDSLDFSDINNLKVQVTDINSKIDKINNSNKLLRKELSLTKNILSVQEMYDMTKGLKHIERFSIKKTKHGELYISNGRNNVFKPASGKMLDQYTAKVFDESLMLIDKLGDKNLNLIQGLKWMIKEMDSGKINNFFTGKVFPKGQRTDSDREIYTVDLYARLALYYIEHHYHQVNKFIPEEIISVPSEDRYRLLQIAKTNVYNRSRDAAKHETEYVAQHFDVSGDSTKFSAKDKVHKYLILIATDPSRSVNEKYLAMSLVCLYYNKNLVMTKDVFNSSLNKMNKYDKESGLLERATDNGSNNHWSVSANWLQGNLNYFSSFCHTISLEITNSLFRCYNKKYQDQHSAANHFAHSDDYTGSFLLTINKSYKEGHRLGLITKNFCGHFIISLLRFGYKAVGFQLNDKKTFLCSWFKEFLSNIISHGQQTFFPYCDLLPISSDYSFKSHFDDFASTTSFIQTSLSHGLDIKAALLMNSVSAYHTSICYNLQRTRNNCPEKVLKTELLPVQIRPTNKLPPELIGLIPFNLSDAVNIFEMILDKLRIRNSRLTISEVVCVDHIDNMIDLCSEEEISYLKLCLLVMKNDSLDPSQVDEDAIPSIDLVSNVVLMPILNQKGNDYGKFYGGRIYKENEIDYKCYRAMNPFLGVTQPKTGEEAYNKLITNFSFLGFRNSLFFSEPSRQFALRLLTSNRNNIKVNLPGYKDDLLSFKDSLLSLQKEADGLPLDSGMLCMVLKGMLLNDSLMAKILQCYYNRVESEFPIYNTKNPTYIYKPYLAMFRPKLVFSELLEFIKPSYLGDPSLCTQNTNNLFTDITVSNNLFYLLRLLTENDELEQVCLEKGDVMTSSNKKELRERFHDVYYPLLYYKDRNLAERYEMYLNGSDSEIPEDMIDQLYSFTLHGQHVVVGDVDLENKSNKHIYSMLRTLQRTIYINCLDRVHCILGNIERKNSIENIFLTFNNFYKRLQLSHRIYMAWRPISNHTDYILHRMESQSQSRAALTTPDEYLISVTDTRLARVRETDLLTQYCSDLRTMYKLLEANDVPREDILEYLKVYQIVHTDEDYIDSENWNQHVYDDNKEQVVSLVNYLGIDPEYLRGSINLSLPSVIWDTEEPHYLTENLESTQATFTIANDRSYAYIQKAGKIFHIETNDVGFIFLQTIGRKIFESYSHKRFEFLTTRPFYGPCLVYRKHNKKFVIKDDNSSLSRNELFLGPIRYMKMSLNISYSEAQLDLKNNRVTIPYEEIGYINYRSKYVTTIKPSLNNINMFVEAYKGYTYCGVEIGNIVKLELNKKITSYKSVSVLQLLTQASQPARVINTFFEKPINPRYESLLGLGIKRTDSPLKDFDFDIVNKFVWDMLGKTNYDKNNEIQASILEIISRDIGDTNSFLKSLCKINPLIKDPLPLTMNQLKSAKSDMKKNCLKFAKGYTYTLVSEISNSDLSMTFFSKLLSSMRSIFPQYCDEEQFSIFRFMVSYGLLEQFLPEDDVESLFE